VAVSFVVADWVQLANTRAIGSSKHVVSETLLVAGMVAAVVFVAVLLFEGALRPGYNPIYHTGSALSLGDRGWIQIANFLQLGLGMLAFAVGVYQRLNSVVGALLVMAFGLGAIVAGVFRMDPMRGYPPGTPSGTPTELTWRHKIHDAAGPLMFLAIGGAGLALAGRLDAHWQMYTVLTSVAGLVLLIATAVAWQKDAKYTGLVQRALILVYCSWIVLLGLHLL
jgi:hypothetical protein